MPTGDLPTIGATAYGASTSIFNVNDLLKSETSAWPVERFEKFDQEANARRILQNQYHRKEPASTPVKEQSMSANVNKRRFVQVFIADPHPLVPCEKAMVYRGEPIFTDDTNEELFFQIPIVDLLTKHNAERTKIINDAIKDRSETLKPARIRDLVMQVVEIAVFSKA